MKNLVQLKKVVDESARGSSIFFGGRMQDQIDKVHHIKRRQAFGPFAFEGQLVILAANTGAGKSILLVQVATQIALGKDGILGSNVPAQPVIYLDFENDPEDWVDRLNGQKLPDNLFRYEMDSEIILSENLETELIRGMTEKIHEHNARVILIDNFKWMIPPGQDERLVSWKLIRSFNNFRKQHNCLIFLATHSNKSKTNGIWTLNDIAGSSDVTRFAQSVFILGEIDGRKDERYLKQLKQRYGQKEYDETNVIIGQLEKLDQQPLQFTWKPEIGPQDENSLVKGENHARSKAVRILEEHEKNPSATAEEIAKKVGCSTRHVSNTLKAS